MSEARLEDAARPGVGTAGGVGVLLYGSAIFAAAFLLFLVQPMLGKRILPWFGGVPAVWMLCLAFFQSALFLGYAYAHLLTRFAGPRAQLGVHGLAIAGALAALPVLPRHAPPVGEDDPTLAILRMLGASVALPFLALASTGPLVQAWFARVRPGRSPYPLYAVSNAGSLLALFAYPFLLEPRLSLSATDTAWSFGFALASLAIIGCAASAARIPDRRGEVPAGGAAPRGFSAGRVTLWLLLAGCGVVLLMGVTNTICLDVASVPFLWILPLAVYLTTFILCFSGRWRHRRLLYGAIAVGALLVENLGVLVAPWLGLYPAQTGLYSAVLFGGCMLLHGEFHRLRPHPRGLTVYYLCLSGGGALGGLFVGIVAPLVFPGYFELFVGLGLGGVLVLVACAGDPTSALRIDGPRWRWALVAPLTLGLLACFGWSLARRPPDTIHRERTFFGVLRVTEAGAGVNLQRQLVHGTTLHGVQFLDPAWRAMPTSYYGRATGLGLALAKRPDEGPVRIGVIGLGAGTLAAYGASGDLVRFYEIDPAVVRIARDDGHFSYLEDSAARIEIVVGDARLSLAEEKLRGIRQAFDFLIVDAFSSDAIPVHLLTREAFAHYREALGQEGLLAFHVSSRHFDLENLVGRMAGEVGLAGLVVSTVRAPRLQSQLSRWVLLGRHRHRLEVLERRIRTNARTLGLPGSAVTIARFDEARLSELRPWTDDFSDPFGVLISRR